jgi:DoxX-like family
MKPRTTARLYWTLIILFCLMMLADGVAGLMLEKNGQEAMRQLGYPLYLMTITGAAKIMGALALLQSRYRTLKEWAFAGFAINFIGAAASVAFAGMGFVATVPALVMTAVLFGIYFLWKRYCANSPQTTAADEMAAFAAPAAATLQQG